MIRSSIALGAFAVIGLAALGCRMLGPKVEARDDFSYNKPAAARRSLVLDNVNGNIVITGVDGLANVEITAVKIVKGRSLDDARSHLADIAINVTESDTALEVETDQPDGSLGRSYSVEYHVKVPSTWM